MARIGRTAGMLAVALALVMVGVYARSAIAASGPVIAADLGGRPIPAVDVGRYQCEDLDFPRIHCYLLAVDLERAVARRLAAPVPAGLGALATTLATTYVRIFADLNYGGASAYLSVSYDDLGVIGWNDRISSFQGQAGNGGTFFEHIYGGGFAYGFNAYQQVSYVGDAWDNVISSLKTTTVVGHGFVFWTGPSYTDSSWKVCGPATWNTLPSGFNNAITSYKSTTLCPQ